MLPTAGGSWAAVMGTFEARRRQLAPVGFRVRLTLGEGLRRMSTLTGSISQAQCGAAISLADRSHGVNRPYCVVWHPTCNGAATPLG